jgi:hypothetical protein
VSDSAALRNTAFDRVGLLAHKVVLRSVADVEVDTGDLLRSVPRSSILQGDLSRKQNVGPTIRALIESVLRRLAGRGQQTYRDPRR